MLVVNCKKKNNIFAYFNPIKNFDKFIMGLFYIYIYIYIYYKLIHLCKKINQCNISI